MLKTFDKKDFSYLLMPLLGLGIFILIGFLLFPKPAKIYREGILRECECLGVIATPKGSGGIGVGESYCIGMPRNCRETQILKDNNGSR